MSTPYPKQTWLTKRREQLELSQDALASQLQLYGFDITRPTISHWENGRHLIPLNDPQLRLALSHVLRISIREMLIQAGYEIQDEPIPADVRRALETFMQLSPSNREALLAMMDTLLKQKIEQERA